MARRSTGWPDGPGTARSSRRFSSTTRQAFINFRHKNTEEPMWRKLAAAALCSIAFGAAAQDEVGVVNMWKQFGLPYLPMIVIEAQQLVQKNAKAAGLGDVKTTRTQRVGPAAELDAL